MFNDVLYCKENIFLFQSLELTSELFKEKKLGCTKSTALFKIKSDWGGIITPDLGSSLML